MPNITGATNFFAKSYENTVPMTLGGSILAGAATVPVNGMTNYTDGDVICFVVDGATPALKQVFTGTKSGANIINAVWTEFPTGGVNVPHSAGATVIDYVSGTHWDLLQKGITSSINQDGSLKTAAVQTALNITGGAAGGWTPSGFTPSAVVANGNRSYTLTFAANNLTTVLSPGMRLQMTRTVTAPTQCTSLNGTTQFWSKTSPAGMTFTNNYVAGGWIKPTSYANASIISRWDGTSGWRCWLDTSGRVNLQAFNAGAANQHIITSYQSVPLNKWTHIAAQQDMTNTTNDGSNNYIMIDGVNVPCTVTRNGTAPTALIQAGTLQVGADNSVDFFPGKIAQAFVYSAKVTQATILASMHQGLAGTETSLISAYSFNGSANDLNTTNVNNLTANGAATAVTADTPFTQTQALSGYTNGTTNFGIVTAVSFSTNTTCVVQVPEGDTIPTAGGVSAVSYATVKVPYGMPVQRGKWVVESLFKSNAGQLNPVLNTWYNPSTQISIPVGEWSVGYEGPLLISGTASSIVAQSTLSTANNSESNTYMSSEINGNSVAQLVSTVKREDDLSLSAQTTHFLNLRQTGGTSITALNFQATDVPLRLRAFCSHL